jgi:uncharacterized membrane protein YdfJ with MMPL/SSD domain
MAGDRSAQTRWGNPVAPLILFCCDASPQAPDSEAAVVHERLERATGMGTGVGLIALVEPGAPIDSPASRAKVEEVAEIIAREPAVARVGTYYESGDQAQVSVDRSMTYVAATFRALEEAELDDAASRIQDELAGVEGVRVGGRALIGDAVGEQVGKDLARAEALAFPIILALSFLFFRGFVAALMPSFVGVLTIFGSFLGLRLGSSRALWPWSVAGTGGRRRRYAVFTPDLGSARRERVSCAMSWRVGTGLDKRRVRVKETD